MTQALTTKHRIESIDILRGVIMLVMALDHVRDFFQAGALTHDATNMATTTVAVFFSRWITHFCAPTFVFLSGISAYIAGTRRTKKELSIFLIKRGLWLVVIEVSIITLALTLNPFYNAFGLQVIWAIGWSMVLLGLLVRLPLRAIAVIGVILFFGHNVLDLMKLPDSGAEGVLLKIFLTSKGSVVFLDKTHVLFVLYAILPWTSVMLLGYVFGSLYKPGYDAAKRKRTLITAGFTALALFLVLRAFNGYGDPAPWAVQTRPMFTFLSFLNVSKYPPSLMYLCMTLSVALLVLAFTERVRTGLARFFMVYGNVPFFYYVLHFYTIRILSIVLFFAQGFNTSQIITKDAPFLFRPANMGFNLGITYLIWLCIILSLYYPCKWFSGYKRTHTQWWLSYL
jgi:uncharacterized membrane protein